MDYNITDTLSSSYSTLANDVAGILPNLVIAILVIIVGWIVASSLKQLTIRVFKALKVNEALDRAGVDRLTDQAGLPLKAGVFVGSLVKWFILLVFFIAALDILGLTDVTFFIRDVILGYLPRVIVAVLILLVAVIVADLAGKGVSTGAKAADVKNPELFGRLTYYAVIVFAVLAALSQLQIAPALVETLFMGIVFALSLALGLAFGLGGRDAAGRYIDHVTNGSKGGGGHSSHGSHQPHHRP